MVSPQGPRSRRYERAVRTSQRAYRALLRAYPRELQDDYGDEMVRCFRDLSREALEGSGRLGLAALWARTLPEWLSTAIKERSTMLTRDPHRSVAGVALTTACILLLFFLAMLLTDEMNWGLFDFVFAGALIFGTGLTYVLVARRGGNMAYRFAVGIALAAAFLLVWINLAVGVIGSEDNPANLMYYGVLAIGFLGAIIAELRPRGMARVLFAMALAQALVPVVALLIWKPQLTSGVAAVLTLNAFFVVLFVGSALLFRNAARDLTPAGAGPEVGPRR
jgi:heme/copper-type cytochrome/quinol oxidase subunit 4